MPIMRISIGAIQIKLFLVAENDFMPFLVPRYVLPGKFQPRIFVMLCQWGWESFFRHCRSGLAVKERWIVLFETVVGRTRWISLTEYCTVEANLDIWRSSREVKTLGRPTGPLQVPWCVLELRKLDTTLWEHPNKLAIFCCDAPCSLRSSIWPNLNSLSGCPVGILTTTKLMNSILEKLQLNEWKNALSLHFGTVWFHIIYLTGYCSNNIEPI